MPYRSEPTSSQSDVEDGEQGGENDDDDDVGMDIDRLQNTEWYAAAAVSLFERSALKIICS